MTDKTTATYRGRDPYDVRPHPLGYVIMSGPTDNDVILGAVYDKGPGSGDPEEMAKVWAASYQIMFPALAEIRNASAIAAYATAAAWPEEAVSLLERIHQRAREALPVPTIGDVNGTTPEAPRPSVQEAALEAAVNAELVVDAAYRHVSSLADPYPDPDAAAPATAADGLTETLVSAIMKAHDASGLVDPAWVDARKCAEAVANAVAPLVTAPVPEVVRALEAGREHAVFRGGFKDTSADIALIDAALSTIREAASTSAGEA
ncbi:hypothetical protein GAY31_19655 [Azospirillum brasilense]|nr:hypothetical protein [Azospirillum brasilense]